jgi:hypothetical protein
VNLAVPLLGCAGAVLIISMFMPGATKRSTIAVSTALVATVVVSLLGLQGLWPTARKHVDAAKEQRKLSSQEANKAGGRAIGVNADFVDWAVAATPPTDRFFLVPANDTVQQWLSYRMLPRLAVKRPQKGTWLVFYDTTPEKAGYPKSQLSDLRSYQPSFSLARLEVPRAPK